MSHSTIRSRYLLLVPAITLLAACAGPAHFVDPETDLPYYERVGVIPFISLAQDRLAGEKFTSVFFTELLRSEFAQVVEPGVFTMAMVRVRGGTPPSNPWSGEDLVRLGSEAGIEGVFVGTVRDFAMVSVGRDQYPQISVEVRFVDVATGRVIWSASQTRRGGPGFPVFGFGVVGTLGELADQIARALLKTLPRE